MERVILLYILILNGLNSWIMLTTKGMESQAGSDTGSMSTTIVKRRELVTHAQCDVDEYGPNCTHCVPQDNCNTGYYTCDKTTGSKVCYPGYLGNNCLSTLVQGTTDYHVTCPDNDCRNGGVCQAGRCCCGRGFAGVLCEVEIIECRNDSCQNGGVCKDMVGDFECICKSPYTGEYCEIEADTHAQTTPSLGATCKTVRCQNGGTCFEDMYFTYCLCPTYYTGLVCESDSRTKPAHIYDCPPNFYGADCNTYCHPQNDCHGHYICEQSTGSKICLSGWHGNKCDTRVLPQSVDPACPTDTGCKNDGQCVGNQCCCRHNYTGTFCQIESIGCLSNPCMNNATCFNVGNAFMCACVGNYTGQMCDHEIVYIPTTTTTTTKSPITTSTTTTKSPSTTSTNNTTNISPSNVTKSLTIDNNVSTHTHTRSISYSSLVITSSSIFDLSAVDHSSVSRLSSDSSSTEPTSSVTLPVSIIASSSSISPSPSESSFSSNTLAVSKTYSSVPSLTPSISSSANVDSVTPSNSNSGSSGTLLNPSMSEIAVSMTTNTPFISSLTSSALSTEVTRSPSSGLLFSNSASLTTSTDSPVLSATSVSSRLSDGSIVSTFAPSLSSPLPTTRPSDVSTTLATSYMETSNSNTELSSSMTNFDSSSNNFEPSVTSSFMTNPDGQSTNSIITKSDIETSSKQTDKIMSSSRQTHTVDTTKRTILSTKTSVASVTHESMTVHDNHNNVGFPTMTTVQHTGSDVISNVSIDHAPNSEQGISTNWKIALIVLGCVLLLLLLLILIVVLTVRQRKKDSMYISQSPAELHGFSKEHFSAQPNIKNPSFDVNNDSDDDSVKHDMYIVNE